MCPSELELGVPVNTDISILERCKKKPLAVFTEAKFGELQMICLHFMNFKIFATFQMYTHIGNRKQNTNFMSKEFVLKDFEIRLCAQTAPFFPDHVVKHTRRNIINTCRHKYLVIKKEFVHPISMF